MRLVVKVINGSKFSLLPLIEFNRWTLLTLSFSCRTSESIPLLFRNNNVTINDDNKVTFLNQSFICLHVKDNISTLF